MATETILVTGANGYLALHIIQQALAKGWNVVGTVRSSRSGSKVTSLFPDAGSQLSLVEVSDITQASYYEAAFKGRNITAVINAASPLVHDAKDQKTEVVDPAINSAIAILTAAQACGGPALKRVVHVGSFIETMDPGLGEAPGRTYTPADWNPVTYEEAVKGGETEAYMGSKVLAERAMWEFVSREQPAFDLVTILPAAIFGPHMGRVDLNHLNVSSHMLWELPAPSGNPSPYNSRHLGAWIDVRDTARALLRAVETPEAGGQRLLAAQRTHWQFVRDAARQINDELRRRIDPGTPGAGEAARHTTYDVDGSKLERTLNMQYTPLFDSMRDSYEQLLEAEKNQKAAA
ncbi:hypothetical protein F5Y19DRAFT_472317 [Xylariaceae sp. FL1651]|nr:hypothetical protein F5Y19DRAFT_472317 [Xylariaceae sp. FL1651]